ncbi:hypothetical protein CsSME_00042284 [Camellia sinensis var. sinensis]
MKIITNLGILMLLISWTCTTNAKVHVHVMNQLGGGRWMDIHCQSKDDDLGYQKVEDGAETMWSFSVNFWGTTLFYCDVLWKGSIWRHFNAYDADKDYRRCRSECRWMISKEGLLYGYNQENGIWEVFVPHSQYS